MQYSKEIDAAVNELLLAFAGIAKTHMPTNWYEKEVDDDCDVACINFTLGIATQFMVRLIEYQVEHYDIAGNIPEIIDEIVNRLEKGLENENP